MENVVFEFYKGRTYTRDLKITGWNKEIDQVYFTIKDDVQDKKYIMQKTLNNGIRLVEKDIDERGRKYCVYNILINATDTDMFEINKKYVFDIAIISGEIKQTVVTGYLRLKGTATATINER